ncbi:MAG: nuclear transport factor 2 family protein [Eggerthellaceae bacterium]|jgi:hypothetical protein
MQAPYEKDKPLLEQRCRDALAAAAAGDTDSFGTFLADGCSVTLPSGQTLSKQEFLTALADGRGHLPSAARFAIDVRISFDGSQAQITCRADADEDANESEAPAWHLELTAAKQDGAWRTAAMRIDAQ